MSKVQRVKGTTVRVPIIIGSMAQKMRQNVQVMGHNFPLTHKWCCYVRGLRENASLTDPVDEQDLSFLIKKVEFQIHDSFPDPLITVSQAPFEIHNAGYGEFPCHITIHFQDPHERPLEYTHPIKFKLDAGQKRASAPVVYEKYNEVTFVEPTEMFYKVLQDNTFENYIKAQRDIYSTKSAD